MRLFFAAIALAAVGHAAAQPAPTADHHQHVFSPTAAALLSLPVVTAKDVIGHLDTAGIRKAVLLSVAYSYGSPNRTVEDELAKVRAENDWTAAQAAEYPDRLIAFCGINPLKEYALAEIARCARDARLAKGLKLHFGNSDIQLDDPAHVEKVRAVFRVANEHRMAIVVHLRASISRKRPYTASQARIFVEQVLPAAPDIPVQIAHFAGTGPGFEDPPSHETIAALAAAIERKEPATRNVWFDIASIVHPSAPPETVAMIVRLIRQVGVGRILYGTDAVVGTNLRPRESWAAFKALPLTPEELARIAGNLAPYMPPKP